MAHQHAERVSVNLDRKNVIALREILGYAGDGSVFGSAADRSGPAPHTVLCFNMPPDVLRAQDSTYREIFNRSRSSASTTHSIYSQMFALVCLIATCPRRGHSSGINSDGDTRGVVLDEAACSFDVSGSRYHRAKMCIEELTDDTERRTCAYRVWLFIYDPNLLPGTVLDDIAASNTDIANAMRATGGSIPRKFQNASHANAREPLLAHNKVTGVVDYSELITRFIGQAQQTAQARAGPSGPSPEHVEELMQLLNNLSENPISGSSMAEAEITASWDAPQSIKFALSPLVGFAAGLGDTRPEQRDIWSYFRRPSDEEHYEGEDARAMERDGHQIGRSGIDVGEMMDADSDEMLLADEDDEELAQLQQGDNQQDSQPLSEAMRLRGTMNAGSFQQFPCPHLVSRIPLRLAGVRIVNVPTHRAIRNVPLDNMGVIRENYSMDVIARKLAVSDEYYDDERPDDQELPGRFKRDAHSLYRQYVQSLQLKPAILDMVDASLEEIRIAPSLIDESAGFVYGRVSVLRKIYKCYLLSLLQANVITCMPRLMRQMTEGTEMAYVPVIIPPVTDQRDSYNSAGDDDDGADADDALSARSIFVEVPLPEELENGVSRAELEEFAEDDDLVAERLRNNKLLSEIRNRFSARGEDPNERDDSGKTFAETLHEFRLAATQRTIHILTSSQNLTSAIKTMRNQYKRRSDESPPLPTHTYSTLNLTPSQNYHLINVEYFNRLFRGATTQTAFCVTRTSALSSTQYSWAIGNHLAIWGDGGAGKTYVFRAVAAILPDGLTYAIDHPTPKAFTTKAGAKEFTDRALVMQEAKPSYVGLDNQVGKQGSGGTGDTDENTLIKAFLDSRRLSTIAYAKTENSSERLAVRINVRLMGTVQAASNSSRPPESSPLMQRYLNMTIPYSKRKGFDKNSQSHETSDEFNADERAMHLDNAHLVGFLVSVVQKLIMTMAIPEPSMAGADYMVRGILREYEQISPSMKQNDTARNREKVFCAIRTTVIEEAINMVLCTRYGKEVILKDLMYEDDEDGQQRPARLRPEFFLEVMKALYATPDAVAYCVSMYSFLWEPGSKIDILTLIIDNANNSPYKEGKRISSDTTAFASTSSTQEILKPKWTDLRAGMRRYFARRHRELQQLEREGHLEQLELEKEQLLQEFPDADPLQHMNNSGAWIHGDSNEPSRPTSAGTGGGFGGGFGGPGGGFGNFGRADTQIDPTYVCFSGKTATAIYERLASEAPGSKRPAATEVKHVVQTLIETYATYHAAVIMTPPEYAEYKRRKRIAQRELERPSDNDAGDDNDHDALYFPGVPAHQSEAGGLESSDDEDLLSASGDADESDAERQDASTTSAGVADFIGGSALSSRNGGASRGPRSDNLFPFWPYTDGTSAEDTQRTYDGEGFYWVLDKSTESRAKRPVAFFLRTDSRNSILKLCVMVEAFAKFKTEGGIDKAIASYFSTSNLVPHPSSPSGDTKDILLCSNHTHIHPDGHEESMPQYRSVVTARRDPNRPMVFPFEHAGSAESSTILNGGNSGINRPSFSSNADTYIGTFFNADEPLTKWLASSHWHNNGIAPPDGETIEQASERYTPEAATEYEYAIARRIKDETDSGFIVNYPADCVDKELSMRRCRDAIVNMSAGHGNAYDTSQTMSLLSESGLAISANELSVLQRLRVAASSIGRCYVDTCNRKIVALDGARRSHLDRIQQANETAQRALESIRQSVSQRTLQSTRNMAERQQLVPQQHTISRSRAEQDLQSRRQQFLQQLDSTEDLAGLPRRIEGTGGSNAMLEPSRPPNTSRRQGQKRKRTSSRRTSRSHKSSRRSRRASRADVRV